jgi:polyhydroxybutyrate depolymerase
VNRKLSFIVLIVLLIARFPHAGRAADLLHWKVDGVKREALVEAPPNHSKEKPPILFVFHGHGGNMRLPERGQAFHANWPEAIVVYPQGLPTPGFLGDTRGMLPGWQHNPGENGDRDLKLVDAMIETLKEKYPIDDDRIYATGFSNGGFFCYLLWSERPQIFAAVAPGAAQLVPSVQLTTPKPVFIYGGRNDRLVRFTGQQAAIDRACKANGCEKEGASCGDSCTLFRSTRQAPVMTFIHDGGHVFVPEVRSLIVQFFKNHSRIAAGR